MLTEREYVAYEKSGDCICPFCKAMAVEWEESDVPLFGKVWVFMKCTKCGKHWADEYTLTKAIIHLDEKEWCICES